jgi:hypothetical protein
VAVQGVCAGSEREEPRTLYSMSSRYLSAGSLPGVEAPPQHFEPAPPIFLLCFVHVKRVNERMIPG